MFITFEGIEGSGKTTQIQSAAAYLSGRNLPVVVTREPGGTAIGLKIRALLLDPEHHDLDPRAELLLYMADRAHHLSTVVRPAVADRKIVLCDRYFDATLAYQGYARGLDIDFLKTLHSLVLDDFTPDLTLLLDLPPQIGLRRAWRQISAGEREAAETRFEKELVPFHERVRAGYLDMALQSPKRFRIVNAEQDPDIVGRDIRGILSHFFDTRYPPD
ncbi:MULTISPECIES: dTMP kinase [Desulfococcus]|jgi:dTMP kinase|uniref:Thymidylate kinase n=1 Tax=Desulfococcus multivorans DSM 2059 TaxID=1121405 RepID=S7TCB5_DESML|nr:dTMP kinase [Desulfococcus multivorans]AQV02923.1 dTMP kinase [Desulfococcus multivorans]EPR34847.1 Thymidylate kinase [Desulfococcus multivorans DSM 2059]MDX9818996.1 dTMP kinase [Desulfococcus multivorans]SJZ96487.1 thymidylate kinase [Desulfococcus multivorans DSM 2059]